MWKFQKWLRTCRSSWQNMETLNVGMRRMTKVMHITPSISLQASIIPMKTEKFISQKIWNIVILTKKMFDRFALLTKKITMKSDCYFKECKDCINREYNNELLCCLSNRLGLAWHRLFLEIPIINKFIDKHRFCYMFEKE